MEDRAYRILGCTVLLRTDSGALRRRFDADYALFRVAPAPRRFRLRFEARLDPAGPGPWVRLGRRGRVPLAGHPSPVPYAYHLLQEALAGALSRFLLLHAGGVARPAGGLLLAGPSGAGKTTLALRLAQQGWWLLSDDLCPVARRTGRLYPFPRSAWAAPAAGGAGGRRGPGHGQKVPVSPAGLSPPGRGRTFPLRWMFCLAPGARRGDVTWYVAGVVASAERRVVQALEALDPRVRVERLPTRFCSLRFGHPAALPLARPLQGLLQAHAPQIYNVYRVDDAAADFARAPQARPIPSHRAAFFLLRHLKNRPVGEAPGGGAGGPAGALFVELLRLLQGAACYELRAGELGQTLGLVQRLAGEGAP